jgi:amino acid transporter
MKLNIRRILIGTPLTMEQMEGEKLNVPLGLAVFSADALSSTAYATDEILIALYTVPALLSMSIPVALAVVGLIFLVVLSYRQIIAVYEDGGGAYVVAKNNLGPSHTLFAAAVAALVLTIALGLFSVRAVEQILAHASSPIVNAAIKTLAGTGVGLALLVFLVGRQLIAIQREGLRAYVESKSSLGPIPSLVAASALMIDYILTVAVSVSAGVAAITSTGLIPVRLAIWWCIGSTLVIMILNLRGVKESGIVFAVPAYIFLCAMGYLIIKGCCFSPQLVQAAPIQTSQWWSSTAAFLFLRAFAHGCAGLTGIEAVSNGVKAFKEPSGVRANQTMTAMGILLASIFLGITWLAYRLHVVPMDNETVLSQVARAVVGDKTPMYWLVQLSTMIMLILAANTAFADFPRVARRLSDDGYMPRQLRNLGDRLVLNNGILVLGLLSVALLVIFGGDTHALLPLYAVGVFLSFTLSQSGMVVYQLKHKPRGYVWGIAINSVGAVVTFGVTLLLAVEKFTEGAWVIVVAVPILVFIFSTIRNHYKSVGRQLALGGEVPQPGSHHVMVLASALGRGTLEALAYAKSICPNVEGVHVSIEEEASERLCASWATWAGDTPLTILRSPYRSLSEPILAYLDRLDEVEHDRYVTIIIPEFVTKKLWHNLLHNQSALQLSALLRFRKGKIVTTYRYYLEE